VPDIVPPDHVDAPVRTVVAGPESVPADCINVEICESLDVSLTVSVPPVRVSPPSSSNTSIVWTRALCVTVKPAGMQTTPPSSGTTGGLQLLAVFQLLSTPPPTQVAVQLAGAECGNWPNGSSAKTSGSAAIKPDRRKSVALLTAQNVAASSGFYKR
jgi:hypothetical protein